jgi:hypothetical protein
MNEYKQSVSVTRRRHQFRRVLIIMSGIVAVFLVFVLGMVTGMEIAKNRVQVGTSPSVRQKIVKQPAPSVERKQAVTIPITQPPQEAPAAKPPAESTSEESTEHGTPAAAPSEEAPAEGQTAPSEKPVKLTFYETLTKKATEPETLPEQSTSQPAPPSEERTRPPSSQGTYIIHLASFRNKAYAEDLVARMENQGYTTVLTPVDIPNKGRWYRVKLSGFGSLTEAEKAQKAVEQAEKLTDTKIVREE